MTTRQNWLAQASGAIAGASLSPLGSVALAQSTALRVGAGLIEPQAQAYYARDAGFFKKFGLDAEVRTSQNGAATAAAVAGGDLQIGVTSVLSLAQAHLRGLPFVAIASGGVHDSRYPGSGVLVLPDSKIANAKALNGKVVAVATAGGLDQLLTSVLVDKNGGDVASVKWLEIKPVIMYDALVQGRIDAACMENPELSNARAKTRTLGDGEDAIAKFFVETAWFCTKDWLAKNEETARRFRRAVSAAGEWAMSNPDRATPILQSALGVGQSHGTQRFATKTVLADYQVLLDAAVHYKFLPSANAADLVWNG